jgi:hypothetical protein
MILLRKDQNVFVVTQWGSKLTNCWEIREKSPTGTKKQA